MKTQTQVYIRISQPYQMPSKTKGKKIVEILPADLSYYDDCGRLEMEIDNCFESEQDAIEFINDPINKHLKKKKLIIETVKVTRTILKSKKI